MSGNIYTCPCGRTRGFNITQVTNACSTCSRSHVGSMFASFRSKCDALSCWCHAVDPIGLVERVMDRVEKVAEEHELDEARREGIKVMLRGLGEDPEREGLLDTPRRVVKAWKEITSGYTVDPKTFVTTFTNDQQFRGMVCVGPVQFYSTCEHHLLPFFGKAWVAYIPDAKIIGLSKLPRVVDMFARRLQNQERLTSQVVKCLKEILNTEDVACVLKAQHFCMMSRGVRQDDAFMITPELGGRFFSEPSTRAEFMAHVAKED